MLRTDISLSGDIFFLHRSRNVKIAQTIEDKTLLDSIRFKTYTYSCELIILISLFLRLDVFVEEKIDGDFIKDVLKIYNSNIQLRYSIFALIYITTQPPPI